ncbi:MAG: Ig-like domain-containing protein [Lachnospiraceae bacterium]|nr:Ig-like domain-containing protein [Lachnospiraceae bacterium]
MKKRKKGEKITRDVVDTDQELELIDLDETSGWSMLDVVSGLEEAGEEEGVPEKAGGKKACTMEASEELVPEKLAEKSKMETAADPQKLFIRGAEAAEGAGEKTEQMSADEEDLEYVSLDDDLEYVSMDDEKEEWTETSEEGTKKGWAEADEDDDLEYLSMDDEEEEEEEEAVSWHREVSFFSRFGTVDKILAGTGLVILLLLVVTGCAFLGKRNTLQQIEALAPVGEQLETVGIIGEDTLLAVADAKKAMEETARIEEEVLKEYEEEELSKEIKVSMKLTSVQKDLKIKFVNSKSGKLVGNVLFEVKITDPSGKTYNQKDEDKDGIIYLTKLEAGTYSVAMVELADMQDYSFSTAAETIKVKENIDYQKIDVSDEIKKESEVNVAQEDTSAKVETEATLTDTVEWVESTKTEVSSESTYVQVQKSDITDPSTTAAGLSLLRSFSFTSEVISSSEEVSRTLDSPASEPAEPDSEGESGPSGPDGEGEGESSGAGSGGEGGSSGSDGEGETKPSEPDSGETKPSEPGSGETKPSEPDSEETKPSQPDSGETKPSQPENPTVAVTGVSLSSTSLSLEEGKTASLSAKITPENATDKTLTWSSSADGVAKVDGNGTVTAVKAGEATITVKAGGKTASCTVKVTAKAVETSITLDKTTATLKTGESLTLKAAVTPAGKTLSWSSSKPEVATVENGKVTAKAAGEATITVTADGKSVSCKVTVTAGYDAKKDTTTALKTKSGKQVYYYANGQYVEAKVADYYKYSNFYTKESNAQYKYTGWQNLDGKTYYFDKNGNKVTGEQVIQGAKYTFNSDGSLHTGSGVLGIDVSTWNGNINWTQVKNAGVSYVIIRTGFRGSTQGALIEDARFKQNIQGATAAGLKVGVYFFTQAINEVEAVEEASMVLSQIKNYKITYPVFIDVESSGGRADGLDAGTRTKVINAFCQTIQNGGYRAGIYANKTWLNQKMNISALSGYKIWLAQYNTQVTYGGRYDMWQYSDKGRISGISTNVDMNLSYMSY